MSHAAAQLLWYQQALQHTPRLASPTRTLILTT